MYLTDELLEKIKNMKNEPPDPYLTVFGFDRKLLLAEGNIWTYTAGFCLKREEKENAHGEMRFFYFPDNRFGIHISLYEERDFLTEKEISYIQEKFQSDGYYDDIKKDHLSFFESLNTLFFEKQTPVWGNWRKESYRHLEAIKNEHHHRFSTHLKTDKHDFHVLITAIEKENEWSIDHIQISQEDDNSYNKAFDLKDMLAIRLPELYQKWFNVIRTA